MASNNNILEINNLSVAFDGRTVVDNLSYSLERGKTLGIVGESGSGKSVSSMALMGLLPKQASVSGSAKLNNTELLTLDEEQMRGIRGKRISMIFQEPMTSLNPVQKCGEQVIEMMRGERSKVKGERKRVLELFKEVLLPRPEKIFDSYPHEISGGQKQRVMIAMALVNNPDILIADEPTTALDVTVQKTIIDLLRSLQQKHGISIIFISHDLGVISQIADDILVMYRGKMVEHGTADQILHHPQQLYTQGLLACRPPLDSKPHRLPTVEDYLEGVKGSEKGVKRSERTNVSADNNDASKADNDAIVTALPCTPMHSHTLLSVKDLDVTYTLKRSLFGRPLQTLKGVDGISFDIHEGETLGLVGESGCGKTTLGRALLRLIDHSSGSISYRGRSLDSLSSREMRALRPKLQIIFQDPYSSLNPRITIGEAICEPLRVHKVSSEQCSVFSEATQDGGSQLNTEHQLLNTEHLTLNTEHLTLNTLKERVTALMQQVGLDPEWYDRYPHELSGGQRQRVCIARALILQPELVVCDESVSALDVSVQAQVLNLLNDLKEHYHYTYLFITHDLSVAHYLSDRIMVMQKGKIVESGTPDEIFRSPKTDYTRTLIEAIPRII